MALIRRFFYYFGGLIIGIIIVFFFLSGKKTSCAYFPNARVLKEIRSNQQVYSPQALQFFEQNNIDTIAVRKLLHQGKVHFNQSQTDQKLDCRVYLISGSHKSQDLQIEVERCTADSLSTISKAGFKN